MGELITQYHTSTAEQDQARHEIEEKAKQIVQLGLAEHSEQPLGRDLQRTISLNVPGFTGSILVERLQDDNVDDYPRGRERLRVLGNNDLAEQIDYDSRSQPGDSRQLAAHDYSKVNLALGSILETFADKSPAPDYKKNLGDIYQSVSEGADSISRIATVLGIEVQDLDTQPWDENEPFEDGLHRYKDSERNIILITNAGAITHEISILQSSGEVILGSYGKVLEQILEQIIDDLDNNEPTAIQLATKFHIMSDHKITVDRRKIGKSPGGLAPEQKPMNLVDVVAETTRILEAFHDALLAYQAKTTEPS